MKYLLIVLFLLVVGCDYNPNQFQDEYKYKLSYMPSHFVARMIAGNYKIVRDRYSGEYALEIPARVILNGDIDGVGCFPCSHRSRSHTGVYLAIISVHDSIVYVKDQVGLNNSPDKIRFNTVKEAENRIRTLISRAYGSLKEFTYREKWEEVK